MALVAAGVSILAATLGAPISPLVIAIALGILVRNTVDVPDWGRSGVSYAGRSLLRLGIVFLGFRLSLGDVLDIGWVGLVVIVATSTITFVGARWIGARLGLSDPMSTLVGAGYAICGLSAVAAVDSLIGADESETAYAVGLVTIAGTLSVFLLPVLGDLAGLSVERFGSWAGAAVHDVGQTVATASTWGDVALESAVVVKLTRVVLLAPLVAVLALGQKGKAASGRRPPIVPLFVVGFLTAAAVASSGVLSDTTLDLLATVERWLLAAALFAIGSKVSLRELRGVGGRPLVLGLGVWTVIGVVSYLGTALYV